MTLPAAEPDEIGLDPARLSLIRERAHGWIEAGDVHRTLVLLIARHGRIGFHEAFGVDGPEPDAAPVAADAIFPIYSQTKSLTAALVMSLVEDGLVGLTRPVQEYLPEFAGERKDQVMVQHLLSHTSGLADNDVFETFGRVGFHVMVAADAEGELEPAEHAFLELAYTWPVAHEPSKVFRYSNLGYVLLGELVRRVSGRSLDDLARERLFGPLGMSESWFCDPPAELEARLVRRSHEHVPEFLDSPAGRAMLGGAGAASSTAADLARFAQLFVDEGRNRDGDVVLAPHSIERMVTNQVPGVPAEIVELRVPEASSGLGWLVSSPRSVIPHWPLPPDGTIQHGGWGWVHPWADFSQDLVGVFCSVADQVRGDGRSPTDLVHHADLFVHMVTASTVD